MFPQYPTPNSEVNKPVPSIPTVRNILKLHLSPKCPEKYIPKAYTARKATSNSPRRDVPSDPLKGAQPSPRLEESLFDPFDSVKLVGLNGKKVKPVAADWGSRTLFTILVVFLVAW